MLCPPPWSVSLSSVFSPNTSLQHSSPRLVWYQPSLTLICNTLLQSSKQSSSTLLCNTLLQYFSTISMSNALLLHFSTTTFSNTSLQDPSPTFLFDTLFQHLWTNFELPIWPKFVQLLGWTISIIYPYISVQGFFIFTQTSRYLPISIAFIALFCTSEKKGGSCCEWYQDDWEHRSRDGPWELWNGSFCVPVPTITYGCFRK